MYGTFAGTWNLAPGSNSSSPRDLGGVTPWKRRRISHHDALYSEGGVAPEKTSHRHLSTTSPNGRKATFSRALLRSRPMSPLGSVGRSRRPIWTRYSGVTERAIVSPIASWNPSWALSRKRNGCRA